MRNTKVIQLFCMLKQKSAKLSVCDYDRQEHIPFATGSCGYTHRFAKYVVGLLKAMTLKDAANL